MSPSDDRPCTTTHIQRQDLSILMPIFRRISIYVYIYMHALILLRILVLRDTAPGTLGMV